MFYLHNGTVYGDTPDGCERMRVTESDGFLMVEPAGESLPGIPPGAAPMTWAELCARAPRSAPEAKKRPEPKGGKRSADL